MTRRSVKLRRSVVAVAVGGTLVALLATGCAPEDPAQRYVRQHVEEHVGTLAGYDPGRTSCTSTPRPWFVEETTEVYVCAARRDDGDCDWFEARLVGRDVTVRLDRPRGGCVLPI